MYSLRTVTVSNFSDYNQETCHNGGNYAFYKIYRETFPGIYEIHYSTSADFEYCDKIGQFRSCSNCCENGRNGCERTYGYVSIRDLWKEVDDDVKYLNDFRIEISE